MKNPFKKQKKHAVSFEEILLDSSNLPSLNTARMEGRIELPLSKRSLHGVGVTFMIIAILFSVQLFRLQIIQGAELADKSKENSIDHSVIIAERGTIYDRRREPIAWNELDPSGMYDFPVRAYTDRRGLGSLIGYVSYPKRDKAGFFYRTEYIGRTGIEDAYNTLLAGQNGQRLVQMTALGQPVSSLIVDNPVPGKEIDLSIDAELSEAMYDIIATTTVQNGFRSGAGAIIDVNTGEILAMTSFPSYDPEILADGKDAKLIQSYNNDVRLPYLDKVIGGVYTPGSIVKPFFAYAALKEHTMDPMKIIVSTGSLSVPNPYDPAHPTVFNDWRAQGPMTMRDAIAYSSDVYFYILGGGFGDQKGLGIANIYKYSQMFGFASTTGIGLLGEQSGTIPSPEWKQKTFHEGWRLGDTYVTSIGQYGFQVTPIEMLRAYAALANGGKLLTPQIMKGTQGTSTDLMLDKEALAIVTDGMRHTVIQNGGTARALERSDVAVAAKSGTAELGASKAHVNSWVAGFFPYEKPKYAFVLFMEFGPRSNTVGAGSVMGKVFDWMAANRPEYLKE